MIAQIICVRMSGYRLDDLGSIRNRNFSLCDHIMYGTGLLSISAAVVCRATLPVGKGIG